MLAGCATMIVTPFTTGSADSYKQHEQKNGVIVGIHPMTTTGEIKDMFEVNLLDEGLLPILVVVENQSTSAASFIIAKDKVYVLNKTTGIITTSQLKELSHTTETVLVILSPLVFGTNAYDNRIVIQQNLADKEFYSQTLGPGEKAQGFIYFQFPKESSPSGNYHVVVEAKKSATDETTTFDFPVNLTLPQ